MSNQTTIYNQGISYEQLKMMDSNGVMRSIKAVYRGDVQIWPNIPDNVTKRVDLKLSTGQWFATIDNIQFGNTLRQSVTEEFMTLITSMVNEIDHEWLDDATNSIFDFDMPIMQNYVVTARPTTVMLTIYDENNEVLLEKSVRNRKPLSDNVDSDIKDILWDEDVCWASTAAREDTIYNILNLTPSDVNVSIYRSNRSCVRLLDGFGNEFGSFYMTRGSYFSSKEFDKIRPIIPTNRIGLNRDLTLAYVFSNVSCKTGTLDAQRGDKYITFNSLGQVTSVTTGFKATGEYSNLILFETCDIQIADPDPNQIGSYTISREVTFIYGSSLDYVFSDVEFSYSDATFDGCQIVSSANSTLNVDNISRILSADRVWNDSLNVVPNPWTTLIVRPLYKFTCTYMDGLTDKPHTTRTLYYSKSFVPGSVTAPSHDNYHLESTVYNPTEYATGRFITQNVTITWNYLINSQTVKFYPFPDDYPEQHNDTTCTVGDEYVLPTEPTSDSHNFAGWWTAKTGGTQVTSSTTFTESSPQVLYAHWNIKTYNVYWMNDSNSASLRTDTVEWGSSSETAYSTGYTLTSPLTKNGKYYRTSKWIVKDANGTYVADCATNAKVSNVKKDLYCYQNLQEVVLIAIWDDSNGTNRMNEYVDYGTTVNMPTSPTKDGHVFVWWNVYDLSWTGKNYGIAPGGSLTANESLYLVGGYWANGYGVCYSDDGHTQYYYLVYNGSIYSKFYHTGADISCSYGNGYVTYTDTGTSWTGYTSNKKSNSNTQVTYKQIDGWIRCVSDSLALYGPTYTLRNVATGDYAYVYSGIEGVTGITSFTGTLIIGRSTSSSSAKTSTWRKYNLSGVSSSIEDNIYTDEYYKVSTTISFTGTDVNPDTVGELRRVEINYDGYLYVHDATLIIDGKNATSEDVDLPWNVPIEVYDGYTYTQDPPGKTGSYYYCARLTITSVTTGVIHTY